MADKKISDLPDGGDPQNTDDFVVARGVTNNKIAWSSMSNAIASGQIAIAASNTTYTSGTVVLTGLGGGVTVSSNVGQAVEISVAAPVAQSVQTQNVVDVTLSGNTAGALALISSGTMTLAGGNNITLSQAGNAVTISAGAEMQTAISGLGNSETTYTSGTVLLSELANITIRSTTGQAFQFSVPGTTGTGNLNAISNSDTTYTSGTIGLSELGAITIRSTTGNQFQFSVNSQTVQTQGGFLSAGVSTGGNTAGSTGITGTQMVLVGSGPISLSQSTGVNGGTVSIDGPALAISAAAASQSNGTVVFSNSNSISFGMNASTITASFDPINFGVSTGGNTLGDTGTKDGAGAQLIFAGGNNITLSVSSDAKSMTVTVSGPPTTAAAWENMPAMGAVLYTHVSGVSKTPFYWVENLPQGIKPAKVAMRVSMVTASTDLSMSIHFGIYTFVNSTSAALLGSGSDAFVVVNGSSVSFSGQRNLVLTSPGTVAAISSLTPGNYLFGAMFSATATAQMNASIYAASAAAGPRLGGVYPGTNQVSTGTSQGIAGMYGRGSTTVNAMPANVGASDLVNQGIGASSPMKPYIFIRS